MNRIIKWLTVIVVVALVQGCATGWERNQWPPLPNDPLSNLGTGWPAARLVEESEMAGEVFKRQIVPLDVYKSFSGTDFGISNTKNWYVVRVRHKGEMRGPPSYYVADRTLVLYFNLKRKTLLSREWVMLINTSAPFDNIIVN